MYYMDHSPPHFHADYQGEQVEVEIKTLKILSGKIPNRAYNLVLEWAAEHREELMANWDRMVASERMKKIEPLK